MRNQLRDYPLSEKGEGTPFIKWPPSRTGAGRIQGLGAGMSKRSSNGAVRLRSYRAWVMGTTALSRPQRFATWPGVFLAAAILLAPDAAVALPEDGRVVDGSAQIVAKSATEL